MKIRAKLLILLKLLFSSGVAKPRFMIAVARIILGQAESFTRFRYAAI
jgi:hypothetical protein